MLKGRAREMGLGSYPEVSLDGAHDRAKEACESERASLRLQEARAITFRACVDGYISAHGAGWRRDKATHGFRAIPSSPRRTDRQGAGADLANEDGDRKPSAGWHRIRARLGRGT